MVQSAYQSCGKPIALQAFISEGGGNAKSAFCSVCNENESFPLLSSYPNQTPSYIDEETNGAVPSDAEMAIVN